MDKMRDTDYLDLYTNIISSLGEWDYKASSNEQELDTGIDQWQTKEPLKRDAIITELLKGYNQSYKNKVKENQKYKKPIIWITIISLVAVIATCIFLTIKISFSYYYNWEKVIYVVAAYLTFAGTIVGLLKVITTYIFPKEEEQHITEIVKVIQANDLEHKKENIKAYIETHRNED